MSVEPVVRARHVALLCLMLGPMLLCTMVGYDALPWWGADPTVAYTPMVTLTPARSVLLDCLSMVGALGLLMSRIGPGGESGPGRRWAWLLVFLAVVGAARAVADGSEQGVSWAAAFVSCATLAAVGRRDELGRIAAALLMGCCVAWAGKGIVQLLVEHPLTVENFRQNKEAVLAAQGWSPGSANALAFERRLVQAEASGWFALANVYAAACAGCLAFFAGAAANLVAGVFGGARTLARERGRNEDVARSARWVWTALIAGMACSAAGVIMSGSKGGLAAAGLAVALAAIVFVVSRARRLPVGELHAPGSSANSQPNSPTNSPTEPASRRLGSIGGVLGIACVLGVLSLVAVRGAIGERIGELSVLFRWFYLEGAARAFAAHPLAGVGVEGFRDAYMLFKPPLSPEEVTSPHSIFFDVAACLGLAGFAVIALLLWCAGRAGRAILTYGVAHPPAQDTSSHAEGIDQSLWLIPALTATLVTFAAIWIEMDVYTAEAALVRLVGLAAWIGLARMLTLPGMMPTSVPLRAGAACAAIVLLAHAQIEMSAVAIVSCGWVFSAIGLGAGSRSGEVPAATTSGDVGPLRLARWAAGIALGIIIGVGVVRFTSMWREERAMARAAALFEPIWLDVERARARAVDGFQVPADIWRDIERRVPEAAEILRKDAGDRFEIARTIAGLDLRAAAARRDRAAIWQVAERVEAKAATFDTASAWGWAGTTWRAVAEQIGPGGDPASRAEAFRRGLTALERASELDPYGLTWPLAAFRVADASGDVTAARRWGEESLRRNAFSRLDPLRQLSPEDTARIQRVLGDSARSPGS